MALFGCTACEFVGRSQRDLDRHKVDVHSKDNADLRCGQCEMSFEKKSLLDAHMAYQHSSKYPTTCPLCPPPSGGKPQQYKTGNYGVHLKTKHQLVTSAQKAPYMPGAVRWILATCHVEGCDLTRLFKARKAAELHHRRVHKSEITIAIYIESFLTKLEIRPIGQYAGSQFHLYEGSGSAYGPNSRRQAATGYTVPQDRVQGTGLTAEG